MGKFRNTIGSIGRIISRMKLSIIAFTLATVTALVPQPTLADHLAPGSNAPALSVKSWYKGKAVKDFEAKKTYVVEFWATWCGPCKESIPHLTELAKKNKDVTFIGVSIWEDDNGDNIKSFVAQMGDKMDYNVGYSGNKDGMAKTWMEAASQNGIPAAFIVQDKKILWVGHPMEMEKPLAEIKAGKFDLKSFKAEFDKQAKLVEFSKVTEKKLSEIRADISAQKIAEAKSKMTAFETEYPSETGRLAGVKLQILFLEDASKAESQLKEMSASRDENTIQTLISLAMEQLDPKGDKSLGSKIMGLLVENAKKGDVLRYYFGAVYAMQTGDKKRAAELADRAITELPDSDMKANENAKKAFEELKKEATKG